MTPILKSIYVTGAIIFYEIKHAHITQAAINRERSGYTKLRTPFEGFKEIGPDKIAHEEIELRPLGTQFDTVSSIAHFTTSNPKKLSFT